MSVSAATGPRATRKWAVLAERGRWRHAPSLSPGLVARTASFAVNEEVIPSEPAGPGASAAAGTGRLTPPDPLTRVSRTREPSNTESRRVRTPSMTAARLARSGRPQAGRATGTRATAELQRS